MVKEEGREKMTNHPKTETIHFDCGRALGVDTCGLNSSPDFVLGFWGSPPPSLRCEDADSSSILLCNPNNEGTETDRPGNARQ